jgi:hypothetical protein
MYNGIKGSFFGMGYLPKNFTNITEEAIVQKKIYIKTLLFSHLQKFPHQVHQLSQ